MRRIHLRKARKDAGLTQAALAERIGKPQSFIAKLETGAKTDTTRTEAAALGKALGVDPMALKFGPAPDEAVAP